MTCMRFFLVFQLQKSGLLILFTLLFLVKPLFAMQFKGVDLSLQSHSLLVAMKTKEELSEFKAFGKSEFSHFRARNKLEPLREALASLKVQIFGAVKDEATLFAYWRFFHFDRLESLLNALDVDLSWIESPKASRSFSRIFERKLNSLVFNYASGFMKESASLRSSIELINHFSSLEEIFDHRYLWVADLVRLNQRVALLVRVLENPPLFADQITRVIGFGLEQADSDHQTLRFRYIGDRAKIAAWLHGLELEDFMGKGMAVSYVRLIPVMD